MKRKRRSRTSAATSPAKQLRRIQSCEDKDQNIHWARTDKPARLAGRGLGTSPGVAPGHGCSEEVSKTCRITRFPKGTWKSRFMQRVPVLKGGHLFQTLR